MNIKELTSRSYIPYSGEPSVSVVKSLEGNYYPGVRIENSSFPLTITAAQNALFCCLSEGEQPKTLFLEDLNAANVHFWKQEFNVWVYPVGDLEDIVFKTIFLDTDEQQAGTLLHSLLEQAVVEHSDFPVSALLKTDKGYVSGVNIECSEWSAGLCAERVAIAKALSYGCTDFHALSIHTRHGEFSSPCGACRQVILEHMPHHPVHLYHADGTQSKHYSSDLLPHSFRSSFLEKESE